MDRVVNTESTQQLMAPLDTSMTEAPLQPLGYCHLPLRPARHTAVESIPPRGTQAGCENPSHKKMAFHKFM